MSNLPPISPDKALSNFLRVIADEAQHNASFRNRLLFAMGNPILIEGQDDLTAIPPQELAVRYDEVTFKRIYTQLKLVGITKVLRTNNLATPADVKFPKSVTPAKKLDQLLNMLWTRSRDRAEEEGRL